MQRCCFQNSLTQVLLIPPPRDCNQVVNVMDVNVGGNTVTDPSCPRTFTVPTLPTWLLLPCRRTKGSADYALKHSLSVDTENRQAATTFQFMCTTFCIGTFPCVLDDAFAWGKALTMVDSETVPGLSYFTHSISLFSPQEPKSVPFCNSINFFASFLSFRHCLSTHSVLGQMWPSCRHLSAHVQRGHFLNNVLNDSNESKWQKPTHTDKSTHTDTHRLMKAWVCLCGLFMYYPSPFNFSTVPRGGGVTLRLCSPSGHLRTAGRAYCFDLYMSTYFLKRLKCRRGDFYWAAP